jgi:hypothetical protein
MQKCLINNLLLYMISNLGSDLENCLHLQNWTQRKSLQFTSLEDTLFKVFESNI